MTSRAAAVRRYVDEFLATGVEANTIRTIWYQIKHQMQPWQKPDQTEADFSEAVTETIGAHLWTLFIEGDVDIYERLDITSKALERRDLPIILFCEKHLPDFDFIADEIEGSVYLSSGQIPSFEIAQIARALHSEPDVYLVTMTDYDPAGQEISHSFAKKLQTALDAFNRGATVVHHGPVTFEEPLARYNTYELSARQKRKWESPYGVELDTIPKSDRIEAIRATLEKLLPLAMFEGLSLDRARAEEYTAWLDDSEEYSHLKQAVKAFKDGVWAKVVELDHTFDTERFELYRSHEVVKMTEIAAL
ncbi:MAG: hypothetical protein MUP09_03560 [Thiovulaceae bacterium]|nr:hypothetical protein [Sulfurimonadaceae bacterium]